MSCCVEITRHAADASAVIEHQSDRLGLEVVIELPVRAQAFGSLCYRSGYRFHLSEDVHETGSSLVLGSLNK